MTACYTRSQVIAAIQAKGVQLRCESCGKTDPVWTLPGEEKRDEVQMASLLKGMAGAMTYAGALEVVPSVPLICTNCGFTRIYNLQYLMRDREDDR